MKFSGATILHALRRLGIGMLIALTLLVGFLIIRALFKGPVAEASTNAYNPGFCLGGWENPESAAGKAGNSAPNGGAAAAYLAPDVFAQIFCGYFPVTPREKPPKAAIVTFSFSLSGEAPSVKEEPQEEEETGPEEEAPAEEETGEESSDGGGEEETEEVVAPEEEAPVEEVPVEEEPAPEEEVTEEEESEPAAEESSDTSSGPTSLLDFFVPTAKAQESASENLLVVSYSFDGVRWYAAGRVNRENAENFTMTVPATMWNDLQNLQVMAAPLPISGERPDIYLESVELKVEADLTLGEIATDGALAVGGVIGEVLGLADTLQTAAVTMVTAPPPAPPAPPAKVKKLSYEIAGNPVNTEGAGRDVPHLTIEEEGTVLRVAAECDDKYFVVLTYRSIEDFTQKPRSFVSNYADVCKGGSFTYRMNHLPVDTVEDVYYLVVAEQGDEGAWVATSPLVPIKIGQKEVDPTPEP